MGEVVIFSKLREGAVVPTRDPENAGFDVYACFDQGYMRIRPHQTVMIPTGICSAFPSNLVGILKERGSTGTKGMEQRSGVIDSGYRGEWFVPITNGTNEDILIIKTGACDLEEDLSPNPVYYPYNKAISQVIFFEVPKIQTVVEDPEVVQSIASKRGKGALGSSGK